MIVIDPVEVIESVEDIEVTAEVVASSLVDSVDVGILVVVGSFVVVIDRVEVIESVEDIAVTAIVVASSVVVSVVV